MTDRDATLLVDHLAAGLPDTAPPPGLVADGLRAQHRRRRTRIVSGLAAGIIVVAGIAVAPIVLDGGAAPGVATSDSFPPPLDGTRWVGRGRAVVAVPQSWGTQELVCGGPSQPTAYRPLNVALDCAAAPPSRVPSLAVVYIDDQFARLLTDGLECHGRAVLTCRGSVNVPDEDVAFTVRTFGVDAREQAEAVMDSLTVLPEGWTTVPWPTNYTRESAVSAITGAGLGTHGADFNGPAMAEPPYGSPVRVGSTIDLVGGMTNEMYVSPGTALPGEVVQVLFPTSMGRGIAYRLDASVSDGWRAAYYLTAPYGGNGSPSWSEDPVGVDDIGIGGPGPDRVVIPPIAAPGTYRLCTANAAEDICTPITVTS